MLVDVGKGLLQGVVRREEARSALDEEIEQGVVCVNRELEWIVSAALNQGLVSTDLFFYSGPAARKERR